jgi:hypothetical protein
LPSQGAEGRQLFYFWRLGRVKILEKKQKFFPVDDLDPNIRIQIRIRIRNLLQARFWSESGYEIFFPIRNNGLAVWYGSETMDLWTYRFKVPSFNVSVMRKESLISVADPGSAAFSTLGSVIGNGFFRIPDKHPGSATLLAILVFIRYLLANQPVHPVL